MSKQIFFSFDKSKYKSDEEIDAEHDSIIRKFLNGRTKEDLSDKEKSVYSELIKKSFGDPRHRNIYQHSCEDALKSAERADELEGIKNHVPPEIIKYESTKKLKFFNWTLKSALKLLFKK